MVCIFTRIFQIPCYPKCSAFKVYYSKIVWSECGKPSETFNTCTNLYRLQVYTRSVTEEIQCNYCTIQTHVNYTVCTNITSPGEPTSTLISCTKATEALCQAMPKHFVG